MKVCLVSIDCQNDFTNSAGALVVPGGEGNAQRTAALVQSLGTRLSHIVTSIDSHHGIDISHPHWFLTGDSTHPDPFTQITFEDFAAGKWTTTNPDHYRKTYRYLQQLALRGRYPHTIWPPHCIIGTEGHQINRTLLDAIFEWETKTHQTRTTVFKGHNPWTEHFSAIEAEVVVDTDRKTTDTNLELVRDLEGYDMALWTGEALSHCLANTFRDTVRNFRDPASIRRQVLLTDTTSNVPGFETFGEAFVRDMAAVGMRCSTAAEIRTELGRSMVV